MRRRGTLRKRRGRKKTGKTTVGCGRRRSHEIGYKNKRKGKENDGRKQMRRK